MGVLGLQCLVGRHRDLNPRPIACESGVRSHYAVGVRPTGEMLKCNFGWLDFFPFELLLSGLDFEVFR